MPVDIDRLSYAELEQLHRRIVERLKMLEAMQAHVDMMAFNIGARVSFRSPRGHHLATVIKYNRKTVTLVDDEGRQWRVTPGLLSPVKDVDTQTGQSAPRAERDRLR